VDPRFLPVWLGLPDRTRAALAGYFLPHRSAKERLTPTRPRLIKWYCPYADQRAFPSGHRYCLNVYVGCAHRCRYCYATGYQPDTPATKRDFTRLLDRDLHDLDAFDVPPAPIHISNSTDPFQPLEGRYGHTLHALRHIVQHRSRFATVTLVTRNPLAAAAAEYVDVLGELCDLPDAHPSRVRLLAADMPALRVEVSLAFWQESARVHYDPCAPDVRSRMDGIRRLRDAGVPVVLRIDPLFPRSPLPLPTRPGLGRFGLSESQSLADLDRLVEFARDAGVWQVVYSVAKIVKPRYARLDPTMEAWRRIYAELSGGSARWKSGSWRLPADVAQEHVLAPFLHICAKYGVPAAHCRDSLISTP